MIDLVCFHTQLILFWKHLQYNPIAKAIIPSADAKVPMAENIFTFIEDQKLVEYALSFAYVLFTVNYFLFHFWDFVNQVLQFIIHETWQV